MSFLLKISTLLDAIVTAVGRVGAWCGLILILVTCYDVFTRYLLDLGSTKLQDFEWWLHTMLFSTALGWTYLRDGHVRIDLLRDRMAPKTKTVIELIGIVFFLFPYCFIILPDTYDFFLRSYEQNEASKSATGLDNVYLVKFFLPFGYTLLTLAAIAVFFRRLVDLIAPDLAATHRADAQG
ncbi:MAG: TRAP transporter small permease subunit [Alphaproteobacteria bacterium]|nr:TRAP transporter small permease subunit [Alphaproteobacteria bacterium]